MRLNLRLVLTFVIVTCLTAAAAMLLANRIIHYQFNNLVIESGSRYTRRLAPILARYYERHNGWQGFSKTMAFFVDNLQNNDNSNIGSGTLLESILRDDRFILLDAGGNVVYDSREDENKPFLSKAIINKGTPVLDKNQKQVGTLIAMSSLGALSTTQRAFLAQINLWMLTASFLIILALALASFFVARSISAPIQSLVQAAHKVAAGDYSQTLPVDNNDELGDMAKSFNKMVSQLEEQRELRRRSMADVAHELRTPLSVLQVDLESLEDGLTQPTPESLHALQAEVKHLNRLVEDLRMLSLVEAHELKLDKSPLNLADLLREVAGRMEESARAGKVALRVEVTEQNLPVNGDEQRLAQVLINLISNALQHTPPEGVIRLGACRAEPWVKVWVSDSGEGIPAEDLPFIFERFYRSDKARSRTKGGSGLGLAIAKSLLEAHDGRIQAQNDPVQGAVFTFMLPLYK
ncbi:MAG: ATP-binding protein [Anaerolineae bacterium]|nr:ATP-binding protein [Anaerolineae bacterium]